MLKNLNYLLSSFIPQKLYWNIAGLIHPWQSVLEDTSNPKEVYKRSKDIVDLLKKLKLVNKNSTVLDIGCGVGRAEYLLSKHIKNGVGIDISSFMIRIAKENVKAQNIIFIVGNGKDLNNLKDGDFDLVFSILVFQHMPRLFFKNYLSESLRVLKKSGKLFFQISTYNREKQDEPPKNHPWAVRYYSKTELKNMLIEIGFKKIKYFRIDGEKLENDQNQILVLAQKYN